MWNLPFLNETQITCSASTWYAQMLVFYILNNARPQLNRQLKQTLTSLMQMARHIRSQGPAKAPTEKLCRFPELPSSVWHKRCSASTIQDERGCADYRRSKRRPRSRWKMQPRFTRGSCCPSVWWSLGRCFRGSISWDALFFRRWFCWTVGVRAHDCRGERCWS